MARDYLFGLLVGIFPIYAGIVLLRANAVHECGYAWDGSPPGVYYGCFNAAIATLVIGIAISIGAMLYYRNKDLKKVGKCKS